MNELSDKLFKLITVYSKIEILISLVIVTLIVGHSMFTAVESERIFGKTTKIQAVEQ